MGSGLGRRTPRRRIRRLAKSRAAHSRLGRRRLTDSIELAALVALLVGVIVVAAWVRDHVDSVSAPSAPVSPPVPATSAPAIEPRGPGDPAYRGVRELLEALPVKGWDRAVDYQRHRFGERWSDDVDVEFGHNGCNTRDDILRRDLTGVELRRGTCLVARGVLHDPYTGATIEFVRGPQSSETVQIDHVVSLADAWYKGARSWSDDQRRNFANDPRNLLAVGERANFDKAFRDAAAWLPPDVAFHCEFAARQIRVKSAYRLWVSANERQALRAVLRSC